MGKKRCLQITVDPSDRTKNEGSLRSQVAALEEEALRSARAEEKIRHLNAVLHAVRHINRLIMQEKSVDGLIRGACEKLVDTRSYYNAWIVLWDADGRISAKAEAGLGKAFSDISDRFELARPVDCYEKIKNSYQPVVVADPLSACTGCPVSHLYDKRGAFVARLLHGEKCYGMLTVSIPGEFLDDGEEHRLFADAASEIAFGLHGLEAEENRKRSEQALRNARDELEQRVKERTHELELLSRRLLNIQEDERKRIAADLHDGIGQSLSAVKFMVETILEQISDTPENPVASSLRSLLPMLTQTSDEVRAIMMNLRPSTLDDLGIIATINWFCRQFQEVYASMTIHKEITITEKQIPPHLKTNIYRVLQEAMNNIAKHSRADHIQIYLTQNHSEIELCITDNGVGCDLKNPATLKALKKGFGITGMKERTELSGGIFEISSEPAVGTRIRAIWPVPV